MSGVAGAAVAAGHWGRGRGRQGRMLRGSLSASCQRGAAPGTRSQHWVPSLPLPQRHGPERGRSQGGRQPRAACWCRRSSGAWLGSGRERCRAATCLYHAAVPCGWVQSSQASAPSVLKMASPFLPPLCRGRANVATDDLSCFTTQSQQAAARRQQRRRQAIVRRRADRGMHARTTPRSALPSSVVAGQATLWRACKPAFERPWV